MVEAVKAREARQKILPPQLPPPLKESKLRSLPNKNGVSQKMTKAAVAAEANKLRAHRKAAKGLKIGKKYEAELAALNAECSSLVPEPLSSPQSDTTPDRFMSQPYQQIPCLAIPIGMVSSDSDSDQESHCSSNSHSVKSYSAQQKRPTMSPSPAARQSGRSRESTKKS